MPPFDLRRLAGAALTRFDAVHIGLTATPAGYIERNTYDFYQCDPGKPDFSYAIRDAFRDGFLVSYRFATGITEIVAEGAEIDDEHYDPVAFERRWTNEESNRLMMREFDRIAWEQYPELAPGQQPGPGKAIVFAITKHHAARLARYLNELHPEHQGRYAEVITSDVADPDALIRRFKTETFPMVAVSVGMLDTGFNCREILHLVLCRRVRSPILYQRRLRIIEPRGEDRGDVQGLAGLPLAHSRPGRLSVPAQEPRHRHRARPPRRPLRAAPLDSRRRRQGDRGVR